MYMDIKNPLRGFHSTVTKEQARTLVPVAARVWLWVLRGYNFDFEGPAARAFARWWEALAAFAGCD